jgi:hypothetical protein
MSEKYSTDDLISVIGNYTTGRVRVITYAECDAIIARLRAEDSDKIKADKLQGGEMSEKKLKPCPFCGREAKIHEADWDCHKSEKPYRVTCDGEYIHTDEACGAETLYFRMPDEAIAAWNRRAK